MLSLTLSLKVILLVGIQAECTYTLRRTYNATNFFDSFYFRDAVYYNSIDPSYHGDPTAGSVNYLNRTNAISSGIARVQNAQVYLGVDHTHTAPVLNGVKGKHARNSVRLESKSTWSSGIMIADIAHMPGTACGVWPSLWFYNFDEDPVGEIDLIEGINQQDSNIVSLHTCGTCSFTGIGGSDNRAQCNNGGTISKQCEDGTNFDGCGNTMSQGSYGTVFNNNKGGVYATWLEDNALNLYWWPRNKIPKDISSGKPDPSGWGKPASQFLGGKNCAIINTDFCGDNIDQPTWDGECRASTGVATCDTFVANNPNAFAETYWLFNSIKFYQA